MSTLLPIRLFFFSTIGILRVAMFLGGHMRHVVGMPEDFTVLENADSPVVVGRRRFIFDRVAQLSVRAPQFKIQFEDLPHDHVRTRSPAPVNPAVYQGFLSGRHRASRHLHSLRHLLGGDGVGPPWYVTTEFAVSAFSLVSDGLLVTSRLSENSDFTTQVLILLFDVVAQHKRPRMRERMPRPL